MLLLDNTVLSNFALVGRFDLLPEALGLDLAVTAQVMQEFVEGVFIGVLPEVDWSRIEVIYLDDQEEVLFKEFLRRVNAGEASCLAVAGHRETAVFSLELFPNNKMKNFEHRFTQMHTDKRKKSVFIRVNLCPISY